MKREGSVAAGARKCGLSRATVYRHMECAAAVATTVAADLAR